MSSDSHATITYTLMSSYEVTINEYYGMPMDPLDPYVQLIMGAPLSPDYIPGPEAPPSPDYIPGPESEPEMEPEENDGDDEKSEGDSIDYPTSEGDNDANDDGDDFLEDDANDEDEEEYEIGESSVAAAAAARQIRPTLTIAKSRRADEAEYQACSEGYCTRRWR
nr:hypothetical protein [Tanacetum cinerariifolium]